MIPSQDEMNAACELSQTRCNSKINSVRITRSQQVKYTNHSKVIMLQEFEKSFSKNVQIKNNDQLTVQACIRKISNNAGRGGERK